ncbi:hypothetical protein MP478_12725 [Chryseobacterium sp. WG14]|uniref:hypothetical protein n=1 Tax=unclassified Chryseobacterium TaxID=2593645 RepID=UPI001DC7B863|nr:MULTISPECIES: hypothetical protein [unclassified Chryseobacterium]MCQ9636083.1 hypothetical protein [Chryseobacterium sp. WG23]MCQ9640245.1 hypothetical protein [Chryseobacterium sp. WG14]CAH0293239.1 hypothetical protein SRABI04_04408 [Chryseobacterium sp. Bi04]
MKNSKLKNIYSAVQLDAVNRGEIISVNEQLAIRGGQAAGWQPLCTVNVNSGCNIGCTPTTPTTPTKEISTIE